MARRLLLFFFCFFLLCTSREPPWADAHVVYDTTEALLSRGELNVTLGGPPWFYAHRNGRKYGVFPLGNVLAMAPSYATYSALRATKLFPEAPLYAFTCHLSPALMMAAACAIFYRLCRRRGASPKLGLLLGLTLGLGTTCLTYARSPYAEALQTLGLLLVVERTGSQSEARSRWGMVGLGAAAGVLLNAKLIYAPVLLLCALYLLICEWRRPAPAYLALARDASLGLLAFLPFCALMLWHNWLKTGSPWISGYQIPGGIFSGDLATGLFGLFFSPGKGLFFYAPPLLLGALGLRTALRRLPGESLLLLAIIAVITLLNARFRAWHGDYCWGPRYLVPLMPLILLLCLPWLPEALSAPRLRRLRQSGLALLLTAGLVVQIIGCLFYWDFYIRILIAVKDGSGAPGWFHDELGHGHFIPSFSPLRGHLWMLSHLVRKDPDMDHDAPWKWVAPQRVDLGSHYQALRIDWWFLDWRQRPDGAPLRSGLLLLGLLASGTLLSAASLRRQALRSAADAGSAPTAEPDPGQ